MRKMFSEGAGMTVLMKEGKAKSVAVHQLFHTTFQGYRFYIDDLVTDATERSRGYGYRIIVWCKEEARSRSCKTLALDSGIQRAESHRFYFCELLSMFAFSFAKPLSRKKTKKLTHILKKEENTSFIGFFSYL